MKLKNCLLLVLMVISPVLPSLVNAATDWDWGGYVAVADSPVIGGFGLNARQQCTGGFIGGTTQTCTTYRGISAFGKIAYTGSLAGGSWYGGSYTNVTGAGFTCPANSAPIEVTAPYIRSDGVSFQPYVYSYPFWSYGRTVENVTLCVKTDTYQ